MENMENKKVFLIHGFEGVPNGAWRTKLMADLGKIDVYACSLSMPTPGEPVLEEWLEEIKRLVDRNKNDEIYLLGHSLGGTTLLRYFERYHDENIKGAIFVSAPCHKTKNEKILNFLNVEPDFEKIRENIKNVIVIHGDNDPYVRLSDGEEIARETNGKLIVIPNGGHLNGSAGIIELPEAYEALLELMNKN
jgi:predicted alpha/beta hydrolase family esterase